MFRYAAKVGLISAIPATAYAYDRPSAPNYPNTSAGVWVRGGVQHNLVGTDGDGVADAAERNVISGNEQAGVLISGAGTDQSTVAGNFIGEVVASPV